MTGYAEMLEEKLLSREATLAIVGLGYVGLTLAVEFAQAGFTVRGIDMDGERVNSLNAGISYLVDVHSSQLERLVKGRRLSATTSYETVKEADVLIISVPTPLRKSKEPDISCILSAVESSLPGFRPGQLVILESTTYPGTTEEILLPRIESRGLSVGHDVFLAFSPERIDPGNPHYRTSDIPKIVGGVTATCAKLATTLYRQAIREVHQVSSPKVAETVKLLENTFRSVNIALANELAMICRKIGVNPWEVIEAAATKPFGFMPFYPGPGIGGHCIPVDPFYLSWKVRLNGYEARFIGLADEINRVMPAHAVGLVADALNERGRCLRGARILVLGVTYKRGVNDIRESPALEILRILAQKGAEVSYADPYIPELVTGERKFTAVGLTEETVREADCTLILTDHPDFDYRAIARWATLVIDTRNAMKVITEGREKIITL